MRLGLFAVALAVLTGCLTPRSMALGQTAAPVGKGAAEVGVYTGVFYGSQVQPPTSRTDPVTMDSFTDQVQYRGFSLPAAEANLQFGLDDSFALNVHLSPAGLQPGVKWTVNKSRVFHVAFLPSVGVGYSSFADDTFTADASGRQTQHDPGYTTAFTFTTGLKTLVSHVSSGFFAGVGYDLLFNRSFSPRIQSVAGGVVELSTTVQTVQHQITASVGMDIALGMVHLRPEIAFALAPMTSRSIVTRQDTNQTEFSSSGGFTWAIFPGFSLAVASEGRRDAREDDDRDRRRDDRDEDRLDGDDDDRPSGGDDDEAGGDDDAPRRRGDEELKRRRPPREDEEY